MGVRRRDRLPPPLWDVVRLAWTEPEGEAVASPAVGMDVVFAPDFGGGDDESLDGPPPSLIVFQREESVFCVCERWSTYAIGVVI